MKGQRDKYLPYVRLMNGKETSADFRTAMRLAIFGPERMKRKVYVMVQKGFPNRAIGVGLTKHGLKTSPLVVACKRQTFREWQLATKRYAQKS